MGDMRIDTKDINKLIGKLKGLNVQGFCEDTAAELGNRTLAEAKNNVAVDTGELRQGYYTVPVKRIGNIYESSTKNNVPYASYEENGHRTRLRKDGTRGWVVGSFTLLKATKKVEKQAPRIIKARWKQFIGGA